MRHLQRQCNEQQEPALSGSSTICREATGKLIFLYYFALSLEIYGTQGKVQGSFCRRLNSL